MPRHALSFVLLSLTLTGGIAAAPAAQGKPTLSQGAVTDSVHGAVAGPAGAEWVVPGGPRIRAQAGAVVRLHGAPQPLLLGPGQRVPGYTLIVRSGTVEVNAPRAATSAVVVVAPRKHVAIVRTGVFRLAALPGSTALANIEGNTLLSISTGPFRPLPAGQVQVSTDTSQASRKLAASPSAIAGRRIVLATEPSARFKGLSWAPVPEASGYRAELVDEATGRVVERVAGKDTTLPSKLGPQPAGRYRLRVWADDPTGIPNTRPADVALRIVGVRLPRGGYLDRTGVYRMGRGQKLALEGAQGLEMSFGAGGYRAASGSLVASRRERTVSLRLPGSTDAVALKLALRTVRSRIEISPRNAVWPKDPVEIRVRLEELSGGPVPKFMKARPRVRLNTEEVDVAFSERDGWLRGVVQPRRGGGPWVLRVAVEDGEAQPLGYDFVEIADASDSSAAATPRVVVTRKVISRR